MAEKLFSVLLTDRDRILTRITTGAGASVEDYSLQYGSGWTILTVGSPSGATTAATGWSTSTCFPRRSQIVEPNAHLVLKDGLDRARAELYEHWERFRRTYEDEWRRLDGT